MMNPGMLVTTKKGLRGRTYNSKGLVNGKIPVYSLQCHFYGGEGEHTPDCGATMGPFTMVLDRAVLCDYSSLTVNEWCYGALLFAMHYNTCYQ
jgi:hypothetical protein